MAEILRLEKRIADVSLLFRRWPEGLVAAVFLKSSARISVIVSLAGVDSILLKYSAISSKFISKEEEV